LSILHSNEFVEASPASVHMPALIGVGLILLLIAIVINVIAHLLVTKMLKIKEGAINIPTPLLIFPR